MIRKSGAMIAAVALAMSGSAFAQGGNSSGGAASENAGASSASGGASPESAPPTEMEPNAPPEQGVLPAGEPAGMEKAQGMNPDTATILAAGGALIAGAVCLALCNSGHGQSSSTTTTSPAH